MTKIKVTLFLFTVTAFTLAFTTLTTSAAEAQDAPPPVVSGERADSPCLERFQHRLAELDEMTGSCDPANEAQAWEAVRSTCAGDFARIQAYLNEHCGGATIPQITRGGGNGGSGHGGSGHGGGGTPRTTTRDELFCRFGAERVHRSGRHDLCECHDGLFPVRVEINWARVDANLPPWRRGIRRVVVGCANPNVPAMTDLTLIIERIQRLEQQTCDTPEDQQTEGMRRLCERVSSLEELTQHHTVQITTLISDVRQLETDLTALRDREDERWAADCGMSPQEWSALPEAERQRMIRDGECDASPGAVASNNDADRWLNFQLGLGPRLLLHTETGVASLYGVAFAQWEPMIFSENVGLYVRGLIGYGTVGDRQGQYGQVPLGESGIWGLGAGVALRFDEHLALNVGAAWDSSLVEGVRGSAFGDYRWHMLSAEARLRWNPVDIFAIEFSLGGGWSRGRIDLPNAPDLVDRDGFGLNGQIGLEFTF